MVKHSKVVGYAVCAMLIAGVWSQAVWAGQVVAFDVSGSGTVNRCGGRAAGCALMVRAASSSVASWRSE